MAKRSNCISSYAKLNMVSGDSGGRMNGSKSKSRIERQAGNVPENKVQGGTNKFKPNQGESYKFKNRIEAGEWMKD